jgi:hypothetical protein
VLAHQATANVVDSVHSKRSDAQRFRRHDMGGDIVEEQDRVGCDSQPVERELVKRRIRFG